MNIKKIVGWVLLAAGLAVIAQTVNLSFGYFTAKQDFPAVFKAPAVDGAKATQNTPNQDLAAIDIQAEMQKAMGQATNEAIVEMLPAESIAKLLNAIVWSMFATFLVYAGAHIAGTGIKMIG